MLVFFNICALFLTGMKDALWLVIVGWMAFIIVSAAQWWPDQKSSSRRFLALLAMRSLSYGVCGLLLGYSNVGIMQNGFSVGIRLSILAVSIHAVVACLVYFVGKCR